MFINLIEDTKEYWQQLDKIESLYQQGALSIQEVDQQVEELMKDLGHKRRESLNYFMKSLSAWLSNYSEILVGLVFVVILTYTWILST